LLARRNVDDDVCIEQRIFVVDRGFQLEWLWCKEAVAARAPSRAHAGKLEIDDLGPEERDNPMNRPSKRDLADAPAHRLRKGDARAELGE